MERLTFIHLSGPRRGESDVVEPPVSLGSDNTDQVRVPGVAPAHARVVERNGDMILQSGISNGGTLLAGELVQEALLRDGDVLELGIGGPKLRFRHEHEKRVPLLQALRWARPEGAPRSLADTTGLLNAVAREVEARTSRVFRLTLLGVVIASATLLALSYAAQRRLQSQLLRVQDSLRRSEAERRSFESRVEEERRRAEDDRRGLRDRAEEYRHHIDDLTARLAAAQASDVQNLRGDLERTRGRLDSLETERAAGERIIREYGAGVCLVQGSYAFYDTAGLPLRVKVDANGEEIRAADGSIQLDVAAQGPLHTVEYLGTGFLVDQRGLVLTNRHVAEPWWNDASAKALSDVGFRPRFLHLRGFFPRLKDPVSLSLDRVDERADLALLKTELKDARSVPVLPLDRTGAGAIAGQAVVVVGYPTGLEAILAKADSAVVNEILEAAGRRSEQVTEALSRRGLIRPSTTQGHIGDVTKTDIVFDAPTTQGGSGGPVFNRKGLVVAVEYAVLPKFGGNAFGVPVRAAVDLLREPRSATSH